MYWWDGKCIAKIFFVVLPTILIGIHITNNFVNCKIQYPTVYYFLARCRNPNAEVELQSSISINCIYQNCSPGYHCEYINLYNGGQYICCGTNPTNPIFGYFFCKKNILILCEILGLPNY